MRYSVSDVAEFGDLSRGTRVVDEQRARADARDPRGDPQRRVRAGAVRRRRCRAAAVRRAARATASRKRPRSSGSARSCARSRGVEGLHGAERLWRPLTSASHSSATAPSAPRSTGCWPRAATRSSARPATGCASCARSSATPRRSGRSLPRDGVLTTDFAAIRDDPSIDVVAEVMGGLEPAGGYVRELLRAGKPVVSANKQLVAREGADLFAIASAAGVQLRFEASRVRGDPGRQGAARVADRDERPPRARDRQRDDELHPLADGARRLLRGRARRGAAARLRGGRSDATTSTARTPPRRWRSSRRSRSARASRSTTSTTRGITEIEPAHVAAAAELGMVVRLVGHRDARRTERSTCASSRRSSSARIRSPPSTARSTP